MEVELLQLAREATTALQAANQPNWTEVVGVLVSGTVGLGQIGLIAWGLRQMGKASEDRNRQLDAMEAAQREQSRTQAETLGKIGQALDRQGEVLAELLRRPRPSKSP